MIKIISVRFLFKTLLKIQRLTETSMYPVEQFALRSDW